MTLPDFFVIGAARCATTSLHYYLHQHPDIVMSRMKEPNHFAFDHSTHPARPRIAAPAIVAKSIPDRAAYERQFADARPGQRCGDASPLYLYIREAAADIHAAVPHARLVALLRHPVDRAYSHHLHIHRGTPDDAVASFRRACAAERTAGREYTPYASGTHVLRMGLYDVQVARYLERFGPDALLILPYEHFVRDPSPGLARICALLGVPDHEFVTDVSYNPSGVRGPGVAARLTALARRAQPKVKAMLPARAVSAVGRLRAAYDRPDPAPPLPDDVRAELVDWFRPSVVSLAGMGVFDTSVWRDFD